MAAFARPRYDPHRKVIFYGKVGIWPFTFQDVVKENICNCPAGTLVTKVIPNINWNETRKMFSENIIPIKNSKTVIEIPRLIVLGDFNPITTKR